MKSEACRATDRRSVPQAAGRLHAPGRWPGACGPAARYQADMPPTAGARHTRKLTVVRGRSFAFRNQNDTKAPPPQGHGSASERLGTLLKMGSQRTEPIQDELLQ